MFGFERNVKPGGMHILFNSGTEVFQTLSAAMNQAQLTNPRHITPSTTPTSIPDVGFTAKDMRLRMGTRYGTRLVVLKTDRFGEEAYKDVPSVLQATPARDIHLLKME